MRIRGAVLNAMGAEPPYDRSRPLAIDEVELRPPGRGEVLVKMAAAGLCHSDLSVIYGDLPRYVALYREGRLPVDKLLTHRLKLDDINAGFERLRTGQAIRQVVEF